MIKQSNEVHGHAVLDMMASSGQTYSRGSLIESMKAKFGPDTEYVICSGGGMSAETLVDTLMERGKFIGGPNAFVFNPSTKCDHD